MSDRDPEYRAFIRQQRCLCCPAPESIHHHQPRRFHGSTSMKCSDYRCVPLCYIHHDEFHRTSWPFYAKYGIDVEAEIARLNALYFFA